MNSAACPALYFAIGGIVATAKDGHRHSHAEALTGFDTDRARRICLWGWATDVLMWPMYAIGAVATGLSHFTNGGQA